MEAWSMQYFAFVANKQRVFLPLTSSFTVYWGPQPGMGLLAFRMVLPALFSLSGDTLIDTSKREFLCALYLLSNWQWRLTITHERLAVFVYSPLQIIWYLLHGRHYSKPVFIHISENWVLFWYYHFKTSFCLNAINMINRLSTLQLILPNILAYIMCLKWEK